MHRLICTFVVYIRQNRFSHDVAQIIVCNYFWQNQFSFVGGRLDNTVVEAVLFNTLQCKSFYYM